MLLKDILAFKKENFFNGAVQADWFYDKEKSDIVSGSYVFHGTKYFGVHEKDVDTLNHSLIDTVSFTRTLADKLFIDKDSSRFVLTIAGYGAGKSHLAVTLANLFSNHNSNTYNTIFSNMRSVDEVQAEIMREYQNKKNLVIVLNGMNNFNLDYEIIKNCKLALEQHGIDSQIVEEMTQAYNTAAHFLKQNFSLLETRFELYAKESKYKLYSGKTLKDKLVDNIQRDREAFNIINEVYKSVNGNAIRWDDGVTGASVLAKVCDELCHKQEIFENIVILFDEFGRYIEYTASNPVIAGDAALQQMFECVQNAKGKMLFAGFIQSDLNAYMQRISENTNVIRYVGRYESSDKYYLSSNFETVLANLIIKKENYNTLICETLENNYDAYLKRLHASIVRWIGKGTKKAVWAKESLFNQMIIKGCYPIHPLTIWMLTNLSAWMQQRSTLTFVENLIQEKSNYELDTANLIDAYVYPIQIIDSPIFYELYNAEEKGLQNSQHCLLYKEILSKYEDRLNKFDMDVLKAIVIINIAKFNIFNKEELIVAIRYCSNMLEENIRGTLKNLENNLGIIEFDSNINRYHFVAEARGKNEFYRVLRNKNLLVRVNDIGEMLNTEVLEKLEMNQNVVPAFAQKNKIVSGEWAYCKEFISIIDFTESYVRNLVSELNSIPDGNTVRGKMLILYASAETDECMDTVRRLYDRFELYKLPVIIFKMLDQEAKLCSLLKERIALLSFTSLEAELYSKFYQSYLVALTSKITRCFNELASNRIMITQDGSEKVTTNARNLAMIQLEKLYFKTVPFMFDGFEKKKSNAPSSLNKICGMLLNKSITNKQTVENLTVEVRNKIKAVLGIDGTYSWGILDRNSQFRSPQNEIIKEIMNEIITEIPEQGYISGDDLLRKYLRAPYSFNIYSLTLLVCCILGDTHEKGILIVYSNDKAITLEGLANILFEDKKGGLDKILRFSYGFMEKDVVERIKGLLDKIKANKYVEECQILLEKLNILQEGQVIPEELNRDIEYCRALLETGIEKHIEINKRLTNDKALVQKVRRLENVAKDYENAILAISRFPMQSNIQGTINFVYRSDYLETYAKLRSMLLDLLENNIEEYIYALSPDANIRQVENINNRVKNIARRLNDLGLIDTQRKAFKVRDKLIEEIEAKYKYQSVIDSIEREIKKWSQELSQGYEILISNLQDIREKKSYIEESINDENVSVRYLMKLQELVDLYEDKLKAIKSDVEMNISCLLKAERLKDIEVILNNITRRNNEYIPSEFLAKIEDIKACYKEAKVKIHTMTQECTIMSLNESISELLVDQDIFPTGVIIRELQLLLNSRIEAQDKWIMQNLNVIGEVDNLSSKVCIDYIEKLQQYPLFVTPEIIDTVENKICELNARVKQCKVEGVVSLFMELNEVERQICMEELKKRI